MNAATNAPAASSTSYPKARKNISFALKTFPKLSSSAEIKMITAP
jgi:hypothetical protein